MEPNRYKNDTERRLAFLYDFARMNPSDNSIVNMYVSALTDALNPYGSQYEAEQSQRAQALKEAEMLGSIENNTAAEQAAMGILAKYYPDLQQQEQTQFDPYQLFRQAKQKEFADYTGEAGNFDPSNQNQLQEAAWLSMLANITPEQYQSYSQPVPGFFSRPFGTSAEDIQKQRLGFRYQ